MKQLSLIWISASLVIAVACKSTKPAPAPVTATTQNTAAPTAPNAQVSMGPASKPSTGIFAPGEEELKTVQMKFTEVSMNQLNEGYTLYTKGACINCHSPKNIYRRSEADWKHIIDDMALKAAITDAQKDAVYKYVMAIKSTQPKSGN